MKDTPLGVPRRTAALVGANGLSAAVLGQFQFVLPWMLLSRGYSAQLAALTMVFVYGPLLLTAVPAGAACDHTDPRWMMRTSNAVALGACAAYPVAVVLGHDWFVLVLVAAVVVGTTRNFSEGALFRGIGDQTHGSSLLRAHALRTTVNQAAIFGSPFFGLLLFRLGGGGAVMLGICLLLGACLVVLSFVPELEREAEPISMMRDTVLGGFGTLRDSRQLRLIGLVYLTWNIFAGAAVGMLPAVLREHLDMNEFTASATFIAGAVVVVVLTLPVVRLAQRRFGAILTFVVASSVQGLAMLFFAPSGAAVVAPLVYCVFLLANAAAAASLNGARATAVANEYQGLLNMTLITIGLTGFIVGLVLVAGLLAQVGFAVALLIIGVGMGVNAATFRRPLLAP